MSHKMLLLNGGIPTASETRPWSKLSFEYDKAVDKVHRKHICLMNNMIAKSIFLIYLLENVYYH